MIYISARSITQAAKKGLLATLGCAANASDPAISHETAATIVVTKPDSEPPGFVIQNNTFAYQNNYAAYLPEVDSSLVNDEEIDYTKLFISPGHLDTIIACLKKYPDSRRNVINSWSPRCLDPKEVGVCITQLYFRLNNGRLDLHSHARANDAYRLLLLDMQLATSIQHAVARATHAPVGEYVHFVDSLHCYKQYENEIQRQLDYMHAAAVWK
ncbi:MAG TPA: thymidylate synthase [Bacillota bacterium]|nr:thymidylate synthase [Bacillota bacterium]